LAAGLAIFGQGRGGQYGCDFQFHGGANLLFGEFLPSIGVGGVRLDNRTNLHIPETGEKNITETGEARIGAFLNVSSQHVMNFSTDTIWRSREILTDSFPDCHPVENSGRERGN
jgi:hypothetical protein